MPLERIDGISREKWMKDYQHRVKEICDERKCSEALRAPARNCYEPLLPGVRLIRASSLCKLMQRSTCAPNKRIKLFFRRGGTDLDVNFRINYVSTSIFSETRRQRVENTTYTRESFTKFTRRIVSCPRN